MLLCAPVENYYQCHLSHTYTHTYIPQSTKCNNYHTELHTSVVALYFPCYCPRNRPGVGWAKGSSPSPAPRRQTRLLSASQCGNSRREIPPPAICHCCDCWLSAALIAGMKWMRVNGCGWNMGKSRKWYT